MPNNLRVLNKGHIFRTLMAMEGKNQLTENFYKMKRKFFCEMKPTKITTKDLDDCCLTAATLSRIKISTALERGLRETHGH